MINSMLFLRVLEGSVFNDNCLELLLLFGELREQRLSIDNSRGVLSRGELFFEEFVGEDNVSEFLDLRCLDIVVDLSFEQSIQLFVLVL